MHFDQEQEWTSVTREYLDELYAEIDKLRDRNKALGELVTMLLEKITKLEDRLKQVAHS